MCILPQFLVMEKNKMRNKASVVGILDIQKVLWKYYVLEEVREWKSREEGKKERSIV